MLEKNQVITGKIVDINHEGVGVLKHEGFIVFVPYTCIDEVVDVRILKVAKSFAFGKIERLLNESDKRISALCKVYHQCGGCSMRHLDYDEECRIKEGYVLDTIKRVGKQSLENVELLPIIKANRVDEYRNKAQYPISRNAKGEVAIGFYAPRSHNVIDYGNCHLQPALFSKVVGIVKQWIQVNKISVYDEEKHQGLLRHLYLRYGEMCNELMVCLVANGESIPHIDSLIEELKLVDGFVSFILNINTNKTNVILGKNVKCLYGQAVIHDVLCGVLVEISPLSFYQVNRNQAQRLYEQAAMMADLKTDETLIDLYCGAGTIGLSMAKNVNEIIGVEIIEEAIENAKINARNNNIVNATFYCGDASHLAKKLLDEKKQPDCIIVDPPRKGLSEEVIEACAKMNPTRIVYISCNVATLARDIELFNQQGYELRKLQAVDLFPRTSHVESVVLMSRVEK